MHYVKLTKEQKAIHKERMTFANKVGTLLAKNPGMMTREAIRAVRAEQRKRKSNNRKPRNRHKKAQDAADGCVDDQYDSELDREFRRIVRGF